MVKGQKSKYKANPPIENMKGFLLTCDSGKEKQAIQELKNIVEALAPAADPSPGSTEDVSKQIEAEIASMKKQKLMRTVETGCRGVLFVRLNTNMRKIDPREVVSKLFASKARQSRHIAKIIPVLGTCNANNSKQIEKLLSEGVPPLLSTQSSVLPKQWTLDFKCRNNDSVALQDVLDPIVASLPATCQLDRNSKEVVIVQVNRVAIM